MAEQTTSSIVIDADPSAVMAVISDFESYPEWAQGVKKAEVVAYEDLGTEAIRRLEVAGFPAIVLYDCHGGDLYQDGQKVYARENA